MSHQTNQLITHLLLHLIAYLRNDLISIHMFIVFHSNGSNKQTIRKPIIRRRRSNTVSQNYVEELKIGIKCDISHLKCDPLTQTTQLLFVNYSRISNKCCLNACRTKLPANASFRVSRPCLRRRSSRRLLFITAMRAATSRRNKLHRNMRRNLPRRVSAPTSFQRRSTESWRTQ